MENLIIKYSSIVALFGEYIYFLNIPPIVGHQNTPGIVFRSEAKAGDQEIIFSPYMSCS